MVKMVISEGIDIVYTNPDGTNVTIRSVGKNVSLGEGVVIYGQDVNIGDNVTIGNCVIIEDHVKILSGTQIGDGSHIKTYTTILSNCRIGTAVVIGRECHIMQKCIINANVGDESTIYGNKTVSGDIPANSYI